MIQRSKIETPFAQSLDRTRRKPDRSNRFGSLYLLLVVVLMCGIPTAAQVRSNIAGVNLAALLNDSISVTASPGTVNFALVANGVSIGNPTLTVNTAWVLGGNAFINTYAYFSTSTAALSDGAGHNIPSSSVSGSVNGAAFQTFTGACPFSANTCLQVVNNFHVTGKPKRVGSINSTLQLQISTVGLSLPAGTYVGVLNIRAEAI
ncbi:MAG TPA: hypothetical protein VFW94_01000 [Candidatus Acidoferrales bacterium]|nr:hypothetical protein [Candidatus Acidoferrales bacterium]